MTHNFSGPDKRGLKTRLFHTILVPLLGLGVALGLVGCDHDDDEASPIPQGSVRVLHTSSDAPPVNIKLDGTVAISDLDYGQSTGFASLDAKDYDIVVEGIIPGGNLDVITVPGFTVAENDRTTIIATDVVASITPLVVADSTATPAANEVAIRVVHASPAADTAVASVDVYVTSPGADISNIAPTFNFAFKDNVDAGALPAGPVQIRATGVNSKTVVYDSGPLDLTPFAGSQLLIAAIDTINSTEKAAAPIKLLVATDTAHLVLLDTDTNSGARVVHASPDAASAANGPVEVYASSSALPASPVELIDTFSYLDVVPGVDSFVGVPNGDYVFNVAPDTDTIGDNVFTSGIIPLAQGSEYTVVAAGRLTNAPSFGLLLTEENLRSVATQASVKVIHAAPAAGTVQVYVTAAGAFSVADVENGLADPALLPSFAYGDITGHVAVAPGNYDIRVVAAGSVAINVENFNLAAGSVSTIIARGPIEPAGAPSDFGVVVLTN
jgi:hypothetical protein